MIYNESYYTTCIVV